MPNILVRGLVAIIYVVIMVPFTVMFFAPVLWPFAVLVTRGTLVSATTFGWTLIAMLVAWAVLFVAMRALVTLQAYWDYEDRGPVLSEEFTAASRSGNNLQAAWILFVWFWKRFPRSFGKHSHG